MAETYTFKDRVLAFFMTIIYILASITFSVLMSAIYIPIFVMLPPCFWLLICIHYCDNSKEGRDFNKRLASGLLIHPIFFTINAPLDIILSVILVIKKVKNKDLPIKWSCNKENL